MNTFSRLVLAGAAATVLPSNAQADWQYTKWGMHVADAQQASRGTLHTPGPSENSPIHGQNAGLVGAYSAGALQFQVALYFHAGNLDLIRLMPDLSTSGAATIEALRGSYGEPVERSPVAPLAETIRWRDDKGNMNIEALNLNGHVVVTYTPLRGVAAGRL